MAGWPAVGLPLAGLVHPMATLRTPVLLAVALASIASTSGLQLDIKAKDVECMGDEIMVDELAIAEFQALQSKSASGEALELTMSLRGPNEQVIHRKKGLSARYAFTGKEEGHHTLCLVNASASSRTEARPAAPDPCTRTRRRRAPSTDPRLDRRCHSARRSGPALRGGGGGLRGGGQEGAPGQHGADAAQDHRHAGRGIWGDAGSAGEGGAAERLERCVAPAPPRGTRPAGPHGPAHPCTRARTEATNEYVLYFSMLSTTVVLCVALWQVYHLKRYLEAKKVL